MARHRSEHEGKHHVVSHGEHATHIHRRRGGAAPKEEFNPEHPMRGHPGGEDFYNAKGSHEEREVEEGEKRGGRVKKKKDGHHADGGRAMRRLDRPGRKRGGGVGSDMRPLSSAAHVKDAEGHKTEMAEETD